jgi:putative chitinase
MKDVTIDLLRKICPKTTVATLTQYVIPINTVGKHFGMSENSKRMAAFLAQLAHESGSFNFTKENLNYSAAGLNKTFKKYFKTLASTNGYARNPEKIANKVYANRMGNGNEASGDGYKYRGRGLIQLTGKDNYQRFATAMKMTIDQVIAYLETPMGAVSSAGWFWDTNKLNIYADKNDFVGLTKRINGGINGLEDRRHHYNIALVELNKK